MATVSPTFIQALLSDPEALKAFLKVFEAYLTKIPTPPTSAGTHPKGPQPAIEGATHQLVTKPLDPKDIDKLTKGTADAVVIERFHAWINGAISMIMVLA